MKQNHPEIHQQWQVCSPCSNASVFCRAKLLLVRRSQSGWWRTIPMMFLMMGRTICLPTLQFLRNFMVPWPIAVRTLLMRISRQLRVKQTPLQMHSVQMQRLLTELGQKTSQYSLLNCKQFLSAKWWFLLRYSSCGPLCIEFGHMCKQKKMRRPRHWRRRSSSLRPALLRP